MVGSARVRETWGRKPLYHSKEGLGDAVAARMEAEWDSKPFFSTKKMI